MYWLDRVELFFICLLEFMNSLTNGFFEFVLINILVEICEPDFAPTTHSKPLKAQNSGIDNCLG